jgi:hypothetical protein
MVKKALDAPTALQTQPFTSSRKTFKARKPKSSFPRRLWPWLSLLLIVGIVVLGTISYLTWSWLKSLNITYGSQPAQPKVTTYAINRTALYADVNVTIVNAQYATSFSDDLIHSAPAMVRLNMRLTDTIKTPVSLVYYDAVRLLLPGQQPLAPSNVHLNPNVLPGAPVQGWLDFPVAAGTKLPALQLQLGVAALNEKLVRIPFSGPFHPDAYRDHLSPVNYTIYYNFKGNTLIYHLNSVDARYSYNGSEVRAGEQFYVLNFSVDNPGGDTSPGLGYDYIRFIVNGNALPPIDDTLPYTFKGGSNSIGGHVTFVAQVGLHSLTIGFLYQLYPGMATYSMGI